MLSYNSIKSNPGDMVAGVDDTNLDGMNTKWFQETNRQLLNESWQPNPSRRVYIPKPNGKMRPLGISSPRDKIIQFAMKMVLETILEPKFSNLSHGFRPKRGCHTALREVRDWKGVTWFIEGDIKNFFPTIDHQILEGLINKHFADKRLINLYWKFVRAGYVEWDSNRPTFVSTDLRVPQGGIISPILSNLVLHELDVYIEEVIKSINNNCKGIKPQITNPEYHRLTMRIKRLKKKILEKAIRGKIRKEEAQELRTYQKQRRLLKSIIPNPEFIRIKYVRYADDWLMGIWGKKEVAKILKEKISEILANMNLELSDEKTLITNARTSRAKFLGTFIKKMASNTGTQYIKDKNGESRKIASGNLWMTAPVLELVKKLEDKGFLKRKDNKWIPKTIGTFTALPIPDMIMRYNAIANGIINYYSFADNRRYLNKIVWILKGSLQKTISRKLKINNKSFISRFGKDISFNVVNKNKENKRIFFTQPDYTRRPMLFLGATKFLDPIQPLFYKISTIMPFGLACSNCGSTNGIEMHHVKHIKTVNVNLNSFDKMMAKINRKQVPLCRECHMQVHNGEYQGKSIKHYNMKWEKVIEN